MATIARRNVIVEFSADTSRLNRGAAQAEKKITGLQKVFQDAQGTFAGLFAFDIASRITSGIGQIAQSTVQLAIDAEQTQVAFETFLGSAEAATKVIAELNKFSETTPFEPTQVIKAGQALLAFGVGADKVTDSLRKIGDISAGTGTDFNELAQIFGKARVQGRLFGEDINQLTGRGIPIIGEFAEQFGVAEDQVKKLVTEGKIGFPELEKAFASLTSEGGRFFELTAKQSETLGGRISTLKGVFDALLRDIGTQLLPTLKALAERFISLLSNINPDNIIRFTKAIALGVAALVSYNTVVKIGTVLTKAYRATMLLAAAATATYRGNTLRAAAAMRLFNTAVKSNPLGLLVTGLTLAASAYAAFGGAADDAAGDQDNFNASVAEGNMLLGAVDDIERRAFTVSKLSKEQTEQLKEDINEQVKLNEAKDARLLASVAFIENSANQIRDKAREDRTAGEQSLLDDLEDVRRNIQKNAEGITEDEIKENVRRLKAADEIADQRLNILNNQTGTLTKAQKKALEKRKKEEEEAQADFVARNQKETIERLRREERILELQKELRDAQFEEDKKRLEARIELEKEFLRDKLALDRESFEEEEDVANSRVKNLQKQSELEINELEKKNNERIASENLTNKKIEKLDKELAEQKLQIQIDTVKAQLDVENLAVEEIIRLQEELARLRRQQGEDETPGPDPEDIEAIALASVAAFNTIADATREANQARIELIEGEIEDQEKRVETALRLAEEGNTTLLELEEKRLEELQEKREQAARRDAQLAAAQVALNQAVAISQTVVAVTKAFAENIFIGIATSIALGAQIAAATIATRQAFGAIQSNADGTEYFDGVGGPTSDSNLSWISRGERIVPTDKNLKYFSTLNEFQKGSPMADMLHNIAQGGPMVSQQAGRASSGYDMGRLEKEMSGIRKLLSKGNTSITLDKDGFSVHMQRYRMKKERLRKRIG